MWYYKEGFKTDKTDFHTKSLHNCAHNGREIKGWFLLPRPNAFNNYCFVNRFCGVKCACSRVKHRNKKEGELGGKQSIKYKGLPPYNKIALRWMDRWMDGATLHLLSIALNSMLRTYQWRFLLCAARYFLCLRWLTFLFFFLFLFSYQSRTPFITFGHLNFL